MNFSACLQQARALVVVAAVVTLPWQRAVWDPPTRDVLGPRSTIAADVALPTEVPVARSALDRQTAPGHWRSATTPPARVEIPAALGDTVRLTLDREAHADPTPSVDEAIAQLLAWVAADQMLRGDEQSDDDTARASAQVTSTGTRR